MDEIELKMQRCIDALIDIKRCGYWPFVSPAPSSTEYKIIDGINDALNALYRAKSNHELVFRNGRDCMHAPAFKIVQYK